MCADPPIFGVAAEFSVENSETAQRDLGFQDHESCAPYVISENLHSRYSSDLRTSGYSPDLTSHITKGSGT